jgi:rhamnose transport system ATP-binding protein
LQTLIRLSAISKAFGGVQALCDVSFDLQSGEVHALVGENGAGKSTLIKIITGAYWPDSGTIEVAGQAIERNEPATAKRLGIAAIYQQPALFADLTVAENIALRLAPPRALRVIHWRERSRRAQELLDQVGARISPSAIVRELSMPQQQLVEIAAALGANSRILILDEPTSSLSESDTEHLFGVIGRLRRQGVGMVYISHRLEELSVVADRVTVLRDGQHVATRAMKDVDRSELVRLMVGRSLSAVYPKREVPQGSVVLELDRVSSAASGVKDISLCVREGEIVGLAGLVGAGRTELARVLFGLAPADSGAIRWRGGPVQIDSPRDAMGLGIAYVPEDRRRNGVVMEMPVAANITLATLRRIARGGLIKFGDERRTAEEYVQRLGVRTPSVDAPVENLSGGNQQKVALARWLAAGPRLFILDEPTQGIDVGAKAEIHRLMSELVERGAAILMLSSELPELLGMCDRIVVMRGGRIAGTLSREEATQERVLALMLGHGDVEGTAA